MIRCPFCHADLRSLPEFPEHCPACREPLGTAGSAEVDRTISDTGEAPAIDDGGRTIPELAPGMADVVQNLSSGSAPSAEKPVSREELSNAQTVQSDDDDFLGAVFDRPAKPAPDGGKTIASQEWAQDSNAKTIQSEEFEDPAASVTVQSEEFAVAEGDQPQADAPDSPDQVSADSVLTIHSEDFTVGEEAAAPAKGADVSNDRTIVSADWDEAASGPADYTEELPADQVKTMQTMWSGALHAAGHPGHTVKGVESGHDGGGGSTLVIKARQLVAPGEKTTRGKEAEYELIRVLGEGGMGVVYDARQTSVDRSVAVKMLKPKTAGDDRQRKKFLAEAVVTGDLDHPNIVPIYDVGTSERGLLFYAMKKVKGTPWMKLLPQKSLPVNLEILMKVADAVGFAHSRGVIHRDLKPENVMLGEYGEVLVMDWGLALPAKGFTKTHAISPAHSMGGTPAYMAPEMASGPLEKITFTSDVYLLGAILYEIVTGKPPHSGKNTMQCLFAAAKNDIRPTDKTGELIEIALRAMATDVQVRYQSVREFQDAIRDYQSHTESFVLSSRAQEDLEKAGKSSDYRDYSRSLFGFEEALSLWDGNTRARAGLVVARQKYAESALRKGDFDLGISLLDPVDSSHADLLRRLKAAQADRSARQQRLKTMKQLAGALVALFVVAVTVAFFWIRTERDRAVIAEQDASTERDRAVQAEQVASTERDRAKEARDVAIEARKDAVTQKERAEEEEEQAKQARAVAEDERRKAVEAEQKEAYEAYIARIGLAAAKIDENEFGSARDRLAECRAASPGLLNWEWGRLMYLCNQSIQMVNAKAPLDSGAFSPDGSKFVTGGWNHTADIWDTSSGKHLLALPHHGLYVHAVAFSPDGRSVATGSNERSRYLRLFNANDGGEIREFTGHTDAVVSVAFSRDGKRLLSASYDKTARIYDVESGRELLVLKGHNWWIWSAAFSPDEKHIVTASQDGSAIIWSAESGQRVAQFLGHRGPVYAAAYSPDGQHVATAGYDKRILVWRPADLKPFDYRKLLSGGNADLPPMTEFSGHTAPVRAVAFSRDGTRLLSGSHDNTVRIWELASAHTLKVLRGHDSWVRACAFSPDDHLVLSVSQDQKARIWSVADYEELRVLQGRVLEGHADAVLGAAFSHDGESIVTASRDRTARTWQFKSGRELQTFEEGHAFLASNAVFVPEGKQLLTAAVDNTVRLWDVATGSQTRTFEHTGRSAALALSHDGKRLLTGGGDKLAQLWDLSNEKEPVLKLAGHKAEVTAVAFSLDDKLLFTGDAGGRGIVWDADTGTIVKRLSGHTGRIGSALFLSEGRLLTASSDRTVAQWDVATGQEQVKLVLKHDDAVLSMAQVPQTHQVLTSCADGQVRLWDADRAELLGTLPVREIVNAVAVSADGSRALTANSEDRIVRLWDLPARREIVFPEGNNSTGPFADFSRRGGLLWTAIFAPDGEGLLTVGGTDARLWDLQTATERISFSPHGIVASAAFSPDGNHIVTASWDSSARVWNARTGKSELKLVGQHSGFVNSALYSPDGSLILTASDDKTEVLWNATTGEMLRVLAGHTGAVRAAVFSRDGRQILTGSSDKTARLWNTATGEILGTFTGHEWAVLSVGFSADGTKIVTGSEDKSARVWDARTQQVLLTLAGHTAAVSSVAFLPGATPEAPSNRLITGSLDSTAKLWDATTGKEILTLKGHTQEVTCVNVSPEGRYLLTGSRDGTAVVWLTDDWRHLAPQTAARP